MIYFYAKEQLLLAPLKYLTSSFLCTFFIYRCFLKPPVKNLPIKPEFSRSLWSEKTFCTLYFYNFGSLATYLPRGEPRTTIFP